MKRFTELFTALDSTTKTNEKLKALINYFKIAPAADAAWALFFLSGNTLPKPASTKLMREWVSDHTKIPLWLLEESYHTVGDLAETFSLLLTPDPNGTNLSLTEIVENRLLPLSKLAEGDKKEALIKLWATLNSSEIFLVMKLITGALRVGIQKTLLSRALAEVTNLPQAQIAHRLMGSFKPSVEAFNNLLDPTLKENDPGQPYPFCLAYPLEIPLELLGDPKNWSVEWKWDGIRAQCLARKGMVLLWSRGEEVITEMFPEIIENFSELPDGTVLDGELVVWEDGRPLPFNDLQKRLGRKKVSKETVKALPTHFLAYDILESAGVDVRGLPFSERRIKLELLFADSRFSNSSISPILNFGSWDELLNLRERTRELRAEGFMLKAQASSYGVGRKKGQWWKWKLEPHTCDAVLLYAQRGHGRRAGLFTDYTFGVWKDDVLVPVAKAYSGLTDKEFTEVNKFIRENTIERFGPVVSVKQELVFELAFEGIGTSARHKAGLALRFPRMKRIRNDKLAKDADSVETLSALFNSLANLPIGEQSKTIFENKFDLNTIKISKS